jgi:hypothetical protein
MFDDCSRDSRHGNSTSVGPLRVIAHDVTKLCAKLLVCRSARFIALPVRNRPASPRNCSKWAAYYRRGLRDVRPDGTIMIHLPIYEWPSVDRSLAGVFDRVFRLRQWISRLKAALYRKCGALIMRGTWYERAWLTMQLQAIGFQAIEFTNFAIAFNGSYHSFVLARK